MANSCRGASSARAVCNPGLSRRRGNILVEEGYSYSFLAAAVALLFFGRSSAASQSSRAGWGQALLFAIVDSHRLCGLPAGASKRQVAVPRRAHLPRAGRGLRSSLRRWLRLHAAYQRAHLPRSADVLPSAASG